MSENVSIPAKLSWYKNRWCLPHIIYYATFKLHSCIKGSNCIINEIKLIHHLVLFWGDRFKVVMLFSAVYYRVIFCKNSSNWFLCPIFYCLAIVTQIMCNVNLKGKEDIDSRISFTWDRSWAETLLMHHHRDHCTNLANLLMLPLHTQLGTTNRGLQYYIITPNLKNNGPQTPQEKKRD